MQNNSDNRALQKCAQPSGQTLPARLAAFENKSIAVIRKTNRDELLGVIADLIIDVVTFHNVSRNMNPAQIAQVSNMIADTREYYFLNPTELKVCFDRGCAGNYGPVYDRLDGSVLFEWIRKYDAERLIEVRAKQAVEQGANNIFDILKHPQLAEAVKMVADKMESRKIDTEVKPRDYSPFDRQVLSEWDANTDETGAGQFKRFDGVYYSFTDYRNHRAKTMQDAQISEK